MSPIETAHSSVDAPTSERVLAEPEAPAVQEALPPYLRLLYQKSISGLRQMHEPFATEWSQVYPPEGCSAYFELPFEAYGRGDNPWNLVGERMVLDWGSLGCGELDKSYNTYTKQGELRRKITEIVAKVDFSDGHKPSIRARLGKNLEGSLQNLNDLFGAMESAHKRVLEDWEKGKVLLSADQLYILQVANPNIGLNSAV